MSDPSIEAGTCETVPWPTTMSWGRLVDRTSRAACLALLAAALTPSASWAEFKTLGTIGPKGPNSDVPEVAIGAKGGGLFVWASADGRIKARARSPTGKLGPTLTLSAAGQSANFARVGIAGNDNAVVVWEEGEESSATVKVRTVSAAGALGPIKTLSAAGQEAHAPAVAVNADGSALAAWAGADGASFRIEARAVTAAGKLGPTKFLSAAGLTAFYSAIALDGQDNAVVVWERSDGSNNRVEARTLTAAGKLGPTKTLSAPGQNADYPVVAVTKQGDAVVAWQRSDGTNLRIQARALAKTGALGSTLTLSAAGEDASNGNIAGDGAGPTVIVWERNDGANLRIQARALSKAGVPDQAQTLSAADEDAVDPDVAVDANGDAWVGWNRSDGTTSRIQVRGRSATGALGPTQTLSAGADNAYHTGIVTTAAGDVLITWEQETQRGSLVEAAAGP